MHHRCFRTNFCFSLKLQVSVIALLLFALVQCSLAGSSHTPSGEGGSCGRPDLETEKEIIAALKSLSVTVSDSSNCGGTGADGCFTSQKRMPDFCGEYEVCVTVKGSVETMNAGYDSGDYTIPAATPDTPTYDADGNMLMYDGWTYAWNAQDRLVSATRGNTRLEFRYDYMGRRFEKKVYESNTLTRHQLFVYDGFKQIAEYDALSNNSLASTYVWQPVGLDVPLLRNGSEFYVSDANKNVVALIDASGVVADTYVYDPFGNCTHTGGSTNPFRFSSEYFDAETGLVYYNYRYYAPGIGRWTKKDGIGEKSIINLYAMCINNSINKVDYLGLSMDDSYIHYIENELNKNSNIWYCERAINVDDLTPAERQNIAKYNILHAYISFGTDPWNGTASGCGFSGGGKGTLPSDEKTFNPTRCKPCHNLKSFLRKLEFGESKGKKCCKATDEEIENCIRNYPARKDYKCPSGITDIWGIYVCWTWAKEALQACCLTCGSKYKTSAD